MNKKFMLIFVVVGMLLCFAVGCEGEGPASAPPTEAKTEAPQPTAQKPEKTVDAKELYAQIKTDMSYEEVMGVMAGHEPFLQGEGAIDTPTGQITTDNVSWMFGKSIITVIFQDKKVIGKDLTNT